MPTPARAKARKETRSARAARFPTKSSGSATSPRYLVRMLKRNVPDRPSLDGLEVRLDARWIEQGSSASTVPRTRPASTRSTPRRRPPAGRSMSATSFRTRTPTPSPATSACGASRSSIRWDGTTTACPPNAACRTTTACAATRRSPTTRRYQPPRQARRRSIRCRSRAATSSSCATG